MKIPPVGALTHTSLISGWDRTSNLWTREAALLQISC